MITLLTTIFTLLTLLFDLFTLFFDYLMWLDTSVLFFYVGLPSIFTSFPLDNFLSLATLLLSWITSFSLSASWSSLVFFSPISLSPTLLLFLNTIRLSLFPSILSLLLRHYCSSFLVPLFSLFLSFFFNHLICLRVFVLQMSI